MSVQKDFVSLLYWIRGQNLQPASFEKDDKFLDPFLKKVASYKNLSPVQKKYALWIPNLKGLKKSGVDMGLTYSENMTEASIRFPGAIVTGLGFGESEAILSALNRVRGYAH